MINSAVADHFVSPSYLCHSVSFFVLYRILVGDVNKGVRIHVVMTIPCMDLAGCRHLVPDDASRTTSLVKHMSDFIEIVYLSGLYHVIHESML